MAKEVRWNTPIVEEFIRLGHLSELEEKVIVTRAKGWTRTRQMMEFNISMSTLDRTIKHLKLLYDDVEPYSDILPPRKVSGVEKYLDEH